MKPKTQRASLPLDDALVEEVFGRFDQLMERSSVELLEDACNCILVVAARNGEDPRDLCKKLARMPTTAAPPVLMDILRTRMISRNLMGHGE